MTQEGEKIVRVELTQMSAEEYALIASGQMSPKVAAEYLKEERICLRSFGQVLREMYPAPDLQGRLVEAFCQDDPEAQPKSVARKVRNWLSGQNRPASREDLFHIAFALELTVAQANTLLGICTDYGIHYREGRDVVYTWFLRHGGTYGQARAFFQTLPAPPRPDQPLAVSKGRHVTQELQAAFLQIQTSQALRACYLEHLEQFGALHLRAYSYAQKYLDQLIHPSCAWGGTREPDYSIEAVMEQYFSLHMPSSTRRSGYTVVQKLLKQNWPNATALKNIRSQREDVPRKLLLLLYVITENVVDEDYRESDEAYITATERLEDHWWALNAILTDCGMPNLDPRNATDWLVLYALTSDDEPMSWRMEQVIEHLFAEETNQ